MLPHEVQEPVVARCVPYHSDIVANRSIQDALAHEENFFHTHPVYHSLAERCGIPQLAKKLSQILAKHIRVMLPDLRSRINAQMVSVKKELSSCGKIPESKSGQGALLLRILTKFSDGIFHSTQLLVVSMQSTSELLYFSLNPGCTSALELSNFRQLVATSNLYLRPELCILRLGMRLSY
eukprot:Gb_39562 [translate_table: standard]